MERNTQKTVFAKITNKTKTAIYFPYEFGGCPLVGVDSFKYLGLTNWKDLS